MTAYSIIAATLAACVIGLFQTGTAEACTTTKCKSTTQTTAKPLQLGGGQKTSARPARQAVAKGKRKSTKSARKAPVQVEQAAPAPAETSVSQDIVNQDSDTPLPVVIVRTTRETNGDDSAVVAEDEFNELDRAAAAPSMMVSTIFNYLGGPADIPDADIQDVAASDVTSDARASFASASNPPPPRQPNIALEYILMTFGGALAAAAAIRMFVI
jgi:hypothetical protein